MSFGRRPAPITNQKRFLARALPDGDLRYFSNANCFSLEKAMYVLTVHGAYFDACRTSHALCLRRSGLRRGSLPSLRCRPGVCGFPSRSSRSERRLVGGEGLEPPTFCV